MARGSGLRTGVDAMQGKIGVVTAPIAELEPGQVKVGGETWTARSFYDGESIPDRLAASRSSRSRASRRS